MGCASSQWPHRLVHLRKRKEKNPISAGWCCTLAPGIRNFNEVGCAWACCTGSPADLGGVGSRKINTEVGQLQNCSASVWCAKKLGNDCIVGWPTAWRAPAPDNQRPQNGFSGKPWRCTNSGAVVAATCLRAIVFCYQASGLMAEACWVL